MPFRCIVRIFRECRLSTEPDFPEDLKEIYLHKWLLSAVAAACHDPISKPFMCRGVLTLAGPQDIGKTRWISSLAPKHWIIAGYTLDPLNKDSVIGAVSHWIVELGELESTLRRDMGRLKAFLTLERDKLRIPYARDLSRFPRRTVFAASVNKPDFLVDDTGNSRFWVIPVIEVNHNHQIDTQQLFAQLFVEYRQGAQWWLTQDESKRLSLVNEKFEERDEVFDAVMTRIDWPMLDKYISAGMVEWLCPRDVLINCCKIENPTKAQRNSCARLLRKLTGLKDGKIHDGVARFPIPRIRDG
jgi:putative DNA primase/helicase